MDLFSKVWIKIRDFNERYFPNWRSTPEIYYTNALAGEVGELCNIIKHRAGGGTNLKDHTDREVLEECADVFIYLHMLVGLLGCNDEGFACIVHDKVNKNINRMEKRKVA